MKEIEVAREKFLKTIQKSKAREICNDCINVGIYCGEFPLKTRVVLFKGTIADIRFNAPIEKCEVKNERKV